MLLPIEFKTDWARLRQRKQQLIQNNNKRENDNRIPHEYKIGDKILLLKPGINPKLATPQLGPYKVLQIFTNGTIRIQRGCVSQRVNIRRVTPFLE